MEENQLKLLRVRSLAQSIMILLGVILIQVICPIIWTAVSILFHYHTDNATRLMQMSVISAVMIMVWCGILYYHSIWRVRPFSYRQICSAKMLISILGLGMGGCIVVTVLLTFLQSLFPQMFVRYNNVIGQFDQGEIVITFLYTIVLGPVAEELIFRGVVMDRLRSAYPFWICNLLQAALFGMYHLNLIQGIYAFLWGILLGLICQRAGSILANILAHMIFNTTNYILGWLFPAGKAVFVPLYLGIFLFGIIFFAIGLWYTTRDNYMKGKE